MNRIEKTFKALNRPALVTFVMAGDPDYGRSLEILKALPGAGADMIELGMPFTDPAADGPVIQAAGQRALHAGANMVQTLRMAAELRQSDKNIPIILMGYMNPVLAYEPARFVNDAAQAGIDGLILVDLPPEEDEILRPLAEKAGIALIRMITPATDEARLKTVLKGASGFLYYVSITGVTGTAQADPEKIRAHIAQIRRHTDLPIAIGFGVRSPEDARTMGAMAEGVVVGSAIVGTIEKNMHNQGLTEMLKRQVAGLAAALEPAATNRALP